MKLITLNIWGGRVFKPLIKFLKNQSKEVDIFCFQEVFHTNTRRKRVSGGARINIYNEIKEALPDFQDFYAPAEHGFDYDGRVDFHLTYGLAIFVRKSIKVDSHGDIFVFQERNSVKNGKFENHGRNLEFISFSKNNKKFSVFNLHGFWTPLGKLDVPERLEQSKKVKNFLGKFPDSRNVLCGDFNLNPDTQSLDILEKNMKNLVKEYKVTSTRSSFYTKPEKFADYILVSPSVKVNDFKVLQDEVSDHLPLFLDFT